MTNGKKRFEVDDDHAEDRERRRVGEATVAMIVVLIAAAIFAGCSVISWLIVRGI